MKILICFVLAFILSQRVWGVVQYVDFLTKKDTNNAFHELVTDHWEMLRSTGAYQNNTSLRGGYFFYASKIKSIIDLCLVSQRCAGQTDYREALLAIQKNLIQHPYVELLFINSSYSEIFFSDFEGEVERLAKTGFSPDFPILINEKIVSDSVDFTVSISLLVHELGHQAGMSSHSFLDKLGAEVRRFYLDEQFVLGFQKRNSILTFFTIPYRQSGQDDFYVNFKNSYINIPYSFKCRLGDLQTASVSMLAADYAEDDSFGRAHIRWNVTCLDKNSIKHYEYPEVFLDFYANPQDGIVTWKFVPVKN